VLENQHLKSILSVILLEITPLPPPESCTIRPELLSPYRGADSCNPLSISGLQTK